MYILLIEDDDIAAQYLRKGLIECGHSIDYAGNGEQGLQLALVKPYDVLVIDRMLPGQDGLSVIRALRGGGKMVPVLVLSALGEVDDRISGLRAGGDDYLVKPYAFGELLARLEVLSRRGAGYVAASTLSVADLELDLVAHKVERSGRQIRLQPKEMQLLEYMMRHAGQLVTRTMLLEHVWDFHFDPGTNVIETQISRLRSKIDRGFSTPLLHTIRKKGYRLSETE